MLTSQPRSRPRTPPVGAGKLVLLFVTLLACYVYFFPRWADWNQNSRFDLIRALVDDHTVSIDKYVQNTGDYATFNGHTYSDKAPGMALLGVPTYAAFERLMPSSVLNRLANSASANGALSGTLDKGGRGLVSDSAYSFVAIAAVSFVIGAVPAAALGVLLCLVLVELGCSRLVAVGATLLYGLGTSAFPYANTLVGHQTSAFLLFAAFAVAFALRRRRLSERWLLLVGFLVGYAAINEYQTALIGAIIVLYAILTRGHTVREWFPVVFRLALGAAPALVLLVVYDFAAFRSPFPVGYLHSTLWSNVHSIGLVSLTYPHPAALWGITFDSYRGLFFLSPYLLLAVPGYVALWRARQHRSEFWVVLLAPLAFLAFNSSSAMWDGGFAVGPRYLVPSLPFLAVAAGLGIDALRRAPAPRVLIALAAVWSLFAVWTETIAGQAFPDYTANPLFALSLPRLLSGDIARNLGMAVGLSGWRSLLPLAILLVGALLLAIIPTFGSPKLAPSLREEQTWA